MASCAVDALIPPVDVFLGPVLTSGIVVSALTKDPMASLAAFAPAWFIVVFLAQFVQSAVPDLVAFLCYPLAVYALGVIMGTLLSLMGSYPRFIDFVNIARTNEEAGARFLDKRRFVWEGLVVYLSLFAILLGSYLVNGNFNTACLGSVPATATAVGWVLIVLGIVGLAVVALVTIFSNSVGSYELVLMWKYALFALVMIAAVTSANNLSYMLAGSTDLYGLWGLMVCAAVWALGWLWFYFVTFVSVAHLEKAMADEGAKEAAIAQTLWRYAADAFVLTRRITAFVLTLGLGNLFVYACMYATAVLAGNNTLNTFIAGLVATALYVIVVVILRFTTCVYHTYRPEKVD